MSLWIKETFVDATRGLRYDESPQYDTSCDTTGELFARLRQEYGACRGKVYQGVAGQPEPRQVGWVFEKRVPYDDAKPSWPKEKRTFLCEVWVTVFDQPDDVVRTAHYHAFD